MDELRHALHVSNIERSSERTQLTQQLMEAKESVRIVEEDTILVKKRLQEMTEEKDRQLRALGNAEDEIKKLKSASTEEKEKLLREIKDVKMEVSS